MDRITAIRAELRSIAAQRPTCPAERGRLIEEYELLVDELVELEAASKR